MKIAQMLQKNDSQLGMIIPNVLVAVLVVNYGISNTIVLEIP